jgi:hypothetical protein
MVRGSFQAHKGRPLGIGKSPSLLGLGCWFWVMGSTGLLHELPPFSSNSLKLDRVVADYESVMNHEREGFWAYSNNQLMEGKGKHANKGYEKRRFKKTRETNFPDESQ